MITLERPAYFRNERLAEYYGLSTDDKSTIQANNADKFYEIDTGKNYRYNESSHEWIEQPEITTAIDTGLPPMTSETAGHFLSNDGSVTHWQDIASQNFVINLTENTADGTYNSDKTYVEIKAAFDGKENIVARLNGSEFHLMVAEFASDTEAGFTFGYTQTRTSGQLITTRAIHYEHTETEDIWADADNTADLSEYLPLTGGTITGELYLANEPTTDAEATTKKYVDEAVASKVPIASAKQGQLKVYVQNGSKPDVCILSDNGDALCVARYTSTGHLIGNKAPTNDNHLANKQYVDEQISNVNILKGDSQVTGSLVVDGSVTITNAPEEVTDATNKDYVDTQISTAVADVVRKQGITVAASSSVSVNLSNGVYLLTVADNYHGGLVSVAVYPDGETISGIVNLNGWQCDRLSGNNGVTLVNNASYAMTVYITSIGAGTYY